MTSRNDLKDHQGPDAITLLTHDHKDVRAMFKAFEVLKDRASISEKTELVHRLCASLAIHMTIEEEIFYPAVRAAIDDDDLMSEADVEHAAAKDLIAQIEGEDAGSDHYDARVTVLGEMVEHHIKEEESKMFPQAKKKSLDLDTIGAELEARQAELVSIAEEGVEIIIDQSEEKTDPGIGPPA